MKTTRRESLKARIDAMNLRVGAALNLSARLAADSAAAAIVCAEVNRLFRRRERLFRAFVAAR